MSKFRHFTLPELLASETAAKKKIDNNPLNI